MKYIARATEVLEQLGTNITSEGIWVAKSILFDASRISHTARTESVLMGLNRRLHVLV